MASVPHGVAPTSAKSESSLTSDTGSESGEESGSTICRTGILDDGYSQFGVAEMTFEPEHVTQISSESEYAADEARCRSPSAKRPRPSPSVPPKIEDDLETVETKDDLETVETIIFTSMEQSSASSAMSPPPPISRPQPSSAISPPVPRQVAPVARPAPPSSSSAISPPVPQPAGVALNERNLIALWTDEEMPLEGALLATVNERLQERCTVVGHWIDTGRNWLWALVRTEKQARQFVKNTNGIAALSRTVTLRSNMSRLSDWPPGTFPFENVRVVPPSKGKGKGKGKNNPPTAKPFVPWTPTWRGGKGSAKDMETPQPKNVVPEVMQLRSKARSSVTPPWRCSSAWD